MAWRHSTRCHALVAVLASSIGFASTSTAQLNPSNDALDRVDLDAQSETYVRIFERALLPGPRGAVVRNQTLTPIHQYVSVRARELDAPWSHDSIDFELAAWGTLWLPEAPRVHAGQLDRSIQTTQPVDWDVSSAHVTQRLGSAWLRLGRQLISGGAARYARFDGARIHWQSDLGWAFSAYAGLSVLPRYDGRPGYYQLGSASDTLLTEPDALPQPERSGYWLAGARADYQLRSTVFAGLSFHEQRADSKLERRQLGMEASWQVDQQLHWLAGLVLDTDSLRLADARSFADYQPRRDLLLSAEYRHAEPALFLSRQSVLSVFSIDAYDELGAEVQFTPWRALRVSPYMYGQIFEAGEYGSRSGLTLRVLPPGSSRWQWLSSYTRVLLPESGYHSLHTGLRSSLNTRLSLLGQWYGYFYDQPINGYRSSNVYALSADWAASRNASLVWGFSAVRSPHAELDLQTLVRFSYNLALSTREAR